MRVNREQYGQEKIFLPGSWKKRQGQVVLTLDAPKGGWRIPQTQTLIVGIDNDDVDRVSQQYIMRWTLRGGVGGARVPIVFDATRLTRISMPLEAFSLSLQVDPYDTGDNDLPTENVTAFAFTGDGGIGQTLGPQYTQPFRVSGLQQVLTIPTGAVRWRMVGVETGSPTPFTTDLSVAVQNGSSTLMNPRTVGATGLDDPNSLYSLFMSGGYLPLPGSANTILLNRVGGAFTFEGFIQYELDL